MARGLLKLPFNDNNISSSQFTRVSDILDTVLSTLDVQSLQFSHDSPQKGITVVPIYR